ncbi:hypothetical protein H9P43_005012 [Blastocladiella emersonii ATCC 22665]|nr:hypothetical protein H9P43_005012 [Blastocladiella emersonii ATCC 22665]
MFGFTSARPNPTHNTTLFISEGDSWIGFYAGWSALKQAHKFNKVIMGVRNEDNEYVRELHKLGAEIQRYDPINDANRLKDLLKGTDSLLLIPVHDEHKMVEASENILRAAEHNNVGRVMLWSHVGVEHHGGNVAAVAGTKPVRPTHEWMKVLECFAKLEKSVRDSKIKNDVIFRLGFISQAFFALSNVMQNRGLFPLTSKDGKMAPVNAKDVGQAGAVLLADPNLFDKHNKQTLILTGPKAYTGPELTNIVNKTLNARIEFEEVPLDSMHEILEKGADADKTEIAITMAGFQLLHEKKLDIVSNDLHKVLGRNPADIDTFFRENADSFRPRSVAGYAVRDAAARQ